MEHKLNFIKLMVFFGLFVCSLSMRIKRREGDQAPTGQCTTFKRGGISRLHWYACCNNCGTSDTSCNGKTYQSASSERYCGNCGVDTKKGNGKHYKTYSCGGCEGQNRVSSKCLEKLRSVYQIPGLCWAFAKCFTKKCKSRSKRSVETPETCFNLRCDPGETVDNCPSDCCGTKNAKCDWSKLSCVDVCCSESTCCDASGSDGLVSMTKYYVIFVTITAFVLDKIFNNA